MLKRYVVSIYLHNRSFGDYWCEIQLAMQCFDFVGVKEFILTQPLLEYNVLHNDLYYSWCLAGGYNFARAFMKSLLNFHAPLFPGISALTKVVSESWYEIVCELLGVWKFKCRL